MPISRIEQDPRKKVPKFVNWTIPRTICSLEFAVAHLAFQLERPLQHVMTENAALLLQCAAESSA